MNKKYIIEVATNPASLKKLRDDLQEATRLPKEGVEVPELSRETKAKVKKDLATLFGVADYQADALRNMVQAMTQGLTDSSSVENMKNQLEQTLQFATDIMDAMQKMGKSTDWMKQGVSFVDDFIKMKESIETVEGLEKSVANLTTTFEVFKDALAETNMDAFLQRFGNSTKAEAAILAKANKELQRVAKSRNEDLQKIMNEAQGEAPDFVGLSREDIEEEYKFAIQAIQKYNKEIEVLRQKFQGRTEALYKDKDYKELIEKLYTQVNLIENMPGLNTEDIGRNLKASLQEATDSVKNAGNEIQNIVDKLKGTGIELAITLPDATSKEFVAEINKFVAKASEEFKDHPIEMALYVASPFKKDAFKKDGTLKELSNKQKELSQGIEKTFRENLQKENLEIGEDDLEGLYNVNTNVIARNIADAFNKLYKSMTSGQALITSATKKWREKIEEDLTVKPKFDIDGAKATLDTDMAKLQDEFEVDEERWLPIHADVDGLIDEIQGELNQKTFDVKVKAGDIEGGNIIVSADQIRFGPPPQGGGNQGQLPLPNVNHKPTSTSEKTEAPSKSIEPVKVESPKQTKAITANSTALQEGTKAQVVLTNLLNELKNSMNVNEGRDEMSEKAIKDARAKTEKNADAIAEREKSVANTNKEWNRVGNERRELEKDIERETQSRDHMKEIRGNIEKKFYDLLKAGDFDKLNQEFSQYMEMLPKAREELQEAIKKVNESSYSDDTKNNRVGKYESQIKLIDQILDKDNPLSITDKTNDGRRVVYEAIGAIYTHQIDEIEDRINAINTDIEKKTRLIGNLSQSSGRSLLAINELEHASEIERKEKNIEKRSKEQSTLSSRINKINKILDGDKDPVNLILDEVNSFWKSYTKNAVDAKKYVETKNAELRALEDSVRGKNIDKNSKEYKEYQHKRTAILEEKAYVDAKKKYDTWEPRRSAMAAAGFDIRGMAETEVLDYLRNLLKNNPSLQTRLMDHDADLKIRSIEDLAYFIKPVQETLGVKPRTENEYLSEQELQANFKEALKVATYIEKAQGVLNKIDGDLNPEAIQDFINYFEHIPGMADAVEHARQYLDAVKDVPEEMFDDVDPKTFLDQFKDSWSSMDNAAKSEFLGALRQTHQFDGNNITAVDDVDNWDKIFNDVLTGYREEASKLRLLGEETNNPQLQQILNVLERSTLLNQTRNAANKYGEHGIVSALFGIQNSKLVGNNSFPKNPIQMTALSKKGKTKVYTIGKQDSKKGSDKAFSWTPEQLRNAFRFANVTEEIKEIVNALFNDALIGQEELQNKIRELQSELSVLEGLGKITTGNPEERKKQLDKFSYHAFDDTDLKDSWHRKKDVEAEIESINDVLAAKLNMQVFPDKLFNDIKGLRDQKRLEREIRELKDGDYSSVKESFKGLTQKEVSERVRNLVSAKEQELEVVKAENTAALEGLLADKIKQLSKLENQIIENSKKVIDVKQQELNATQESLNQLKPFAERAQQEVDNLLNNLFSSGKLKLSQGADADESPWAGKYKYQDSELAKYENRQDANKRESERLKAQIAKLESGDYDNETKTLLAENLAKQEEKARNQQASLKQQIQNLEARISTIDQEIKDGKLKEEDGNKQKENAITSLEKAKEDLAVLEQKMQNGELKSEIEQAQKGYIQQLINNLKSALDAIKQDSVALDDVIQAVLDLEDDMQLSKEKAAHERMQAKGKEKQTKNLQGKIKRGNAYGNAKRKYKRAVYSEAYAEHKNEELAKYGITSSEDSVAKVDNLLRRIQFAKTHGLMDTTELEQMVAEYERLDKKYHDTEDLKALGKATEEDIKKAREELKKYRSQLIDKFFTTEGWFKTTRLETKFSEEEGEAKDYIKKKQEEANQAKDKVNAKKQAVEAKEKQYKGAVEQYTDLLYQEYIEKPKQEIRDALKQEIDAMRSASSDNKARKDAVAQNIENDPRYKEAYEKLAIEQANDPKLIALKERKKALQQPRDELINDPEYQELLRAYEELKDKKLLGTDLAKEVREKIAKGYKNIGADGKNTKEFTDIENAIKEIEQAYRERFNQIRDQLIAEEKKKIDTELIPDSAYSKYSVDIKAAADNRDQAIANLQEEAKNDVKIVEELSGNEKYKSLLREYDRLKQQGQEGSRGYKNVLTKLRGAWIEEQTKRINDTFDAFVNSVVEELFEKSGTKHDYKTSLGARKKEVIDRLMNDNTEFANIFEAIKNEKGIDAISAKGKNKILDYFKLSKELMAHGIPDGLIDVNDLAVIADTGIRKSDDLGKHLNKLRDLLFKRIKGIITNAMGQIEDSDINDTSVASEVEAAEKAVEIAKNAAIEEIKNKTDRELLAEESSKAVDAHEKEAKKYDDKYAEDEKTRNEILQKHPEITEDVLKAARAGTLLHQEVAAEEQKTAEAIKESNSAVESRTSSNKPWTNQSGDRGSSGGYYYGGYGYSYGGVIDTSDLAKEGTLRGIYEVLNGGAPKGGWDDSVSESSKVHENQGSTLSANNVLGPSKTLAESVKLLMNSAKELPNEVISLLGNKSILKQESSGERGFIAMDDVHRAISGTKGTVKAALHNHPNGRALMSKADIKEFFNLAYDKNTPNNKRIKVHGAYSDAELSSLNFTGISEKIAKSIIDDTFDLFETTVNTFGLRYDHKDQKYYDESNVALNYNNADDYKVMKFLEDVFYLGLQENFQKHGFDQAFQHVEGVDQIDDWVATITETATVIQNRAKQFKEQSKVHTPIDESSKVDTTIGPNVSTRQIQETTSQVADTIIENATQAAKNVAEASGNTAQTTDASDLSSIYSDILSKFGFEKLSKDKIKAIKDQSLQYIDNEINAEEFDDVFTNNDGKISVISDAVYKVSELREKIINSILESLEETALMTGNMNTYAHAENDIYQYLDSVLPKVTGAIVESAGNAAVSVATQTTGNAYANDLSSIFGQVFERFKFDFISDELAREMQQFAVNLLKGHVNEGLYSDILKSTDDGRITALSDDMYNNADIKKKIIDVVVRHLKLAFDNLNEHPLYDISPDAVSKYVREILPGSNTKQKQVKAKKDAQTQTASVDDKSVKNANDVADANTNTEKSKSKQNELSAKVAQNDKDAADAAERRADAEEEAAQQSAKNANNTERQATATDKAAENQKEQAVNAEKISSDSRVYQPSIKQYEHNYNKGLSGIAQEITLKSILSILSNGVKVTKSEDGSKSGGKKGGKKKKEDKPLNLTAGDAWATAQEYIKENYSNFTSLSSLKPVSGGYSIDVFRPNDVEAYAAAQKRVNDLIEAGKQETEEFKQAQIELNKLKYEQEKITLRIGILDDKVQVTQEKSGFQNLAIGIKAASKELQTVEGILAQIHEAGALTIGDDGNPSSSNQVVTNYLTSLKTLEKYKNSLSPDMLFDPVVNQQLSKYTLDVQNYRKEVMALLKVTSQLNVGKKIETDKLAGGIEGLSNDEVKKLMLDIVSDGNKLETTFKKLIPVTDEFGDVIGYQLAYTVRTGKHEVQEMTASLNPLTNELRVQKGEVKEVATGWERFFAGLKGKAASIMQYLISITSIHDVFRYFSQGVQYVREIDGALTELKKVTDETDASYAKFLQDMSKTGSVIGATVSNLTTMAAEWSRLGFSMEEAGRLAESTAILLNVSEFEDATTASEALISTMQAFQYTADESQHVVDILNEVKVTCLLIQ